MTEITNEKIESILDTYPSLIARAATEAEELKIAFEKQEVDYKADVEKYRLEFKTTGKKVPQAEIDSNIAVKFRAEQKALIDKESAYKKKLIEVNWLKDTMNSYNTLVYLRTAEIKGGLRK